MKWTFAIMILLALCLTVSATPASKSHDEQSSDSTTKKKLTCDPFGMCQRCPETALQEPFCQPFGNRRLMHCRDEGTASSDGERPEFWPCGRIVAQERADFFEFVLCNVAFACLGLLTLFVRSKRLADMHARTLAARIGLTRAPRR